MFQGLRSQRLLALFALGWLLLNVPLLSCGTGRSCSGACRCMPLALFGGWGGLIALAAWIAEPRRARSLNA